MGDRKDPLQLLSPVVAAWFRERVGTPSEVQARVWPRVAAGEAPRCRG